MNQLAYSADGPVSLTSTGGGVAQRVLVVDDDPDVLALLGEALQPLGCDVQLAEAGDQALALFRAEQPAVVLTDLRLPGLDGLMVLKAIREAGARTEVLVVTAYADLGSAIEAVRRGAFDYLVKPLDLETLRQRVRQALERYRLMWEREALIEELTRANEALRAAQAQLVERERLAALGQVVVGLHHAILNPLGGALGALHVSKGACTPAMRAEALARAEEELRRIERIVRGLASGQDRPVTSYVGKTTMLDLERVRDS